MFNIIRRNNEDSARYAYLSPCYWNPCEILMIPGLFEFVGKQQTTFFLLDG